MKYIDEEMELNNLFNNCMFDEYEEYKSSLIRDGYIIETHSMPNYRSHLIWKDKCPVIEVDDKKKTCRYRSHQYLNDLEIEELINQFNNK